MAVKIVEKIDIQTLVSRINKEKDLMKIELCLSRITKASKEVAAKLLKMNKNK